MQKFIKPVINLFAKALKKDYQTTDKMKKSILTSRSQLPEIFLFTGIFIICSIFGNVIVAQGTGNGLNATVEVFNLNDVSLTNQPVFSVVPVPYNKYDSNTDFSKFTLTNYQNEIVPAQIEIGRKWWDMPGQPVRDLHVTFVADDVPSMAPATYTFRDSGVNPLPLMQASATETAALITVDTGKIKFELRKKGGEIQRAWVMKDGNYELVIDNSVTGSNYITNRFNNTFSQSIDGDGNETPFVASIEKNGPIEVRIRLESPATVVHNSSNVYYSKFPEVKDPVPGYVRFYRAYAGGNNIRVDDLMLNNPIRPGYGANSGEGKYGWPLFYKTHIAEFKTTIANPSFKVGYNNNTQYSFTGNQVYSSSNDLRAVQNSSTNCTIGGVQAGYCTWAQIADPDRQLAVTLSAKFMKEENPNAYAFNKNQKTIAFEIAPDIGTLYMLDDMSAAYNEYTITLHDNLPTNQETHNLYKSIRQPVMGRPSLDTIKQTNTLTEFRNMVPTQLYDNTSSVDRDYANFGGQSETQDEWGLSSRHRQSISGGVRGTGYTKSITTKFPETNQVLAFNLRDNLLRPMLPPTLWATVGSGGTPNLNSQGNPISGNPMTLNGYQGSGPDVNSSQLATPALLGFETQFPGAFWDSQITMRPILTGNVGNNKYTPGKTIPSHRVSTGRTVYDIHHHWQLVPEVYVLTGDPVAKYFMESYSHIFLVWSLDAYNLAAAGEEVGTEPRGLGNMTYSIVQTYSATGDQDLRQAIDYLVDAYDLSQEWVKDASPEKNGRTHVSNAGYSFQDGYQVSALAILQEMIDPESETAKKVWRILHGDPSLGREGVANGLGKARFPKYKLEIDMAPPYGACATAVPGIVAAAVHTALYPNPLTGQLQPVDYINKYIVPYLKGESWDGIQGDSPYYIDQNAILQGNPIQSNLRRYIEFTNDHIMTLANNFPALLTVGGPIPSTFYDTTPPSVPTDLNSAVSTSSQINLSWTASTDPESDISHYNIYRNGTNIGQSSIIPFADTGLTESSTHTYEVSAVNGRGLESAKSAPVSATTLADTAPPTIISVNVSGDSTKVTVVFSEPVEQTSAENALNYQIDNVITVYTALLGTNLKTVTLTTSPHSEGITYTLTVNSIKDRATVPNIITTDIIEPYTYIAQLVISNLTVTSGEAYEVVQDGLQNGALVYIDRSYTYSSVPALVQGATYIKTANDDKGTSDLSLITFGVGLNVTVYVAHDNRTTTKPSWMASFTDTGDDMVTTDTTLSIFAKDFSAGTITLGGNGGGDSMYTVIVMRSEVPTDPDIDPPVISAISVQTTDNSTTIIWTTDESADSKVLYGLNTSYGSNVSDAFFVANHSLQITGLMPDTLYHYQIVSKDAADNERSSVDATFITDSSPPVDTEAPTTPLGLNATAVSSSQINLTWNASTDNVGVTGYKIYRNNTQISTTASTSYSDTGLSPSTAYTYTISAYDAAANESGTSIPVSDSTLSPDNTAPSIPTNLQATTMSANQINLTWSSSTDNVAVTGYKIYRNGTQITTISNTTYQDTGLSPSTTYTYTVSSFDAAGNVSGQSTSVSTTTLEGTSFPANTWMNINPTQTIFPSGFNGKFQWRSWGRFVYRPISKSILFYEGYVDGNLYPSSIYANTLYSWDIDTNTLVGLEINENDPATRHTYKGLEYVPSKDAIYMVGGAHSTDGNTLDLKSTWKYSFQTQSWNKLSPFIVGGNVYDGNLNYVPGTNSLFFMVNDSGLWGHVYKFGLDSDIWTELPKDPQGEAIPSFHEGTSSTVDTKRNQIVFFGVDSTNNLVTYDPATNKFTTLSAGGPAATGFLAYNSKWDVYVAVGGESGETWIYHPDNNNWEKISTNPFSFNRTKTIAGYVAYDQANDLVAIMGNGGEFWGFQYVPTNLPPDPTPPTRPQSLNTTIQSESKIYLTWQSSNDPESGISNYNIYRNGTNIGQSTTTSFADTGLTESSTYTYEVSAVNGRGMESTKSTPVPATTLADTTPPTIISVNASSDSTKVTVVFSEPVEQTSAENALNYQIDNGITVSTASLGTDLKTVTLTTSPHTEGISYTLTVNSINDRASTPNMIASNTAKTYVFAAQLVISNLTVTSGKVYEVVQDGPQNGALVYIDRSYTYSSVPALVQGATYIKTANDDKGSSGPSFMTFGVSQNVTVYVAHDNSINTKPSWMASFTDTGDDIVTTDTALSLFAKDFPSGTITLGGNEGASDSMYTVIITEQGTGDTTPPATPTGLRIE